MSHRLLVFLALLLALGPPNLAADAGPLGPAVAEASPRPLGFARGKRADERAWKKVLQATRDGDSAATLQRASLYLDEFPEGSHVLTAHRVAGFAAVELDLPAACRSHFDSYLKKGGEEGRDRVAAEAAICRAQEGKSEDIQDELADIVQNTDDPLIGGRAGRSLVGFHKRRGDLQEAFKAQGLMLERSLYEPATDIVDSRELAKSLSDEALDLLRTDNREKAPLLAGLFAFLQLERSGAIDDEEGGLHARIYFVHGYTAHPLLALIPDAAELRDSRPPAGPAKVGVLLPLSGRFAVPGTNARRGFEMALDDLRAIEGNQLGEVELILFDTEGNPEKAVEGARELAGTHEVLAILGPIVGAEAEAVGAVADELAVPVLMSSQRPGVTDGHPTVFNNWVRPEEQVDAALRYVLQNWDTSKMAIAYPEREAASRMVERFWNGLEAGGGQIAFIESYPDGTTDFTKVARRFTGSHFWTNRPTEIDFVLPFLESRGKPQMEGMPRNVKVGEEVSGLFVPDHFRAMSMLAPGFVSEAINLSGYFDEEISPKIPIIGGAALNHPELLRRGGRFANGILLVDSFFAGSHEEVVQRFVLQYELLHGQRPALLESVCYDSARFLFELIDQGVGYRDELVAALSGSTPAASILRSTGFDAERQMEHSMLVLQIQKGQFRQVHPPPPEAPVRLQVTETGQLVAFQENEEGESIDVPVLGVTQLRLPVSPEAEAEAEEDAGTEAEPASTDGNSPAPRPVEAAPETETPETEAEPDGGAP